MNFLKYLHFALLAHLTYMPKIQILYLANYRNTPAHAQIHIHLCSESPEHTDTFMFVYIHKHTYMGT